MHKGTKTERYLRFAFRVGFKVDEVGELSIPSGIRARISFGSNGYSYFRFTHKSERHQVYIHQLQAFQLYGDRVFESAEVRHKNGVKTDNRSCNILIGSRSDNAMDMSPYERRRTSLIASGHLVRTDWREIERDRDDGMSYRDLEKKHGVARSTLSYRFSKNKPANRVARYR